MEHVETTEKIKIHVDENLHHSPTPTTGAALYRLGNIGGEHELFREVGGNLEEAPVPDDETEIHLRAEERFRTKKATIHIVVNAEPKEVHKKILKFRDVVLLAFPNGPSGPNIIYTVTFKKAAGPTHAGSLVEGGTVKVKNGTVFSVTFTDKS